MALWWLLLRRSYLRLSDQSSHAQKATLCKWYWPYLLQNEAWLWIQGITNYFHGKKKPMTEAGVPQYNLVVWGFFKMLPVNPKGKQLYSSIMAVSKVRFHASAWHSAPPPLPLSLQEEFGNSCPGAAVVWNAAGHGVPVLVKFKEIIVMIVIREFI